MHACIFPPGSHAIFHSEHPFFSCPMVSSGWHISGDRGGSAVGRSETLREIVKYIWSPSPHQGLPWANFRGTCYKSTIQMYVCMYVCMYIYISIGIYIYMYIYICMYIYIYRYVCVCIYIYIFTCVWNLATIPKSDNLTGALKKKWLFLARIANLATYQHLTWTIGSDCMINNGYQWFLMVNEGETWLTTMIMISIIWWSGWSCSELWNAWGAGWSRELSLPTAW